MLKYKENCNFTFYSYELMNMIHNFKSNVNELYEEYKITGDSTDVCSRNMMQSKSLHTNEFDPIMATDMEW